jgi:pimeloyl-ACP methyl ester carboxylesterase
MADKMNLQFSKKSLRQKVNISMQIIFGVLLVSVLIIMGILLAWSPGKPQPFLDENGKPLAGSISEKIHITIDGTEQGMFIKSKNLANPILLYIHGGIPDYFLTQSYPTGMEDYFTVVWWEMRGQGISFNSSISKDTLTTDQLVDDTIEVTNYLRERFHQDKIYLMGHSGGTFYGIQAVYKAPELYRAYIAVAQISNQLESEKLAYTYMLDEFKKQGNSKMVAELEKAPVTDESIPLPSSYEAIRDPGMHSLGIGTMHNMDSIVTGLLIPSFKFRDYTLGEKIGLWRGKIAFGKTTFNQQLATDLNQVVPEVKVPVYFFHGIYDYTVNYTLAKDYFERLQAPMKGFYTFEQSAHSPMFEEPEKMGKIIREDVLAGKNNLADIK